MIERKCARGSRASNMLDIYLSQFGGISLNYRWMFFGQRLLDDDFALCCVCVADT